MKTRTVTAIALMGILVQGCAMMRLDRQDQQDFAFRGGVPCPMKEIQPHQDSTGVGGGADLDNPPEFTCREEVYQCSFGNLFSPVCKRIQ